MVDLKWCKKQDRGIELVEPNDNLAEDYIKSAEKRKRKFYKQKMMYLYQKSDILYTK